MPTIHCANPACRAPKDVRQADIDRGWGKYCSKSCKAIVQTKGRRAPSEQHQALARAFPAAQAPRLSGLIGGYVNRAEMIDAYCSAYDRYHVPTPLSEPRY